MRDLNSGRFDEAEMRGESRKFQNAKNGAVPRLHDPTRLIGRRVLRKETLPSLRHLANFK